MKDGDLERGFDRLPDSGGPPDRWQEKVLARIEQPQPTRRARWPILVAGSGLFAATAAVALFLALRAPEPSAPPDAARSHALAERLQHAAERLEALEDEAYRRLLAARTDAERARVQQELEQAKKQLERVQRRLIKMRARWPRIDDGKLSVKCDPNDPLCGIN